MSKEEKSFIFMSPEDLKNKEDKMRQRIRSGELAMEMIEGKKGYTKDDWVEITWYYLEDLLGAEKDWDELKIELKEQLEKMREKES